MVLKLERIACFTLVRGSEHSTPRGPLGHEGVLSRGQRSGSECRQSRLPLPRLPGGTRPPNCAGQPPCPRGPPVSLETEPDQPE